MLTSVLLMVVGLLLLVAGADWLVKGAAGLAELFGVSPLVVGLTVVAYGTSMPELVVSALAALDGRSAIALGNVVGSNIANIGLILGITALVSPPLVQGSLIKREVPVLIVSSLVLPLVMWNGFISRLDGALLIAGAAAFTWATVRYASTSEADDPIVAGALENVQAKTPRGSRLRLSVFAVVGLAMLLSGGKLFVDAAVTVATALGVSERVIGLTVVAIGTSLPELAASVVAALRGQAAMAVGNVIGSNIFNVLFVLGVTSALSPIAGDVMTARKDLLLMLGFTAGAALLLRGPRRITRWEGAILLVAYIATLIWLSV